VANAVLPSPHTVVVYLALFSLVWFVPCCFQVIRWFPTSWNPSAVAGEAFLVFVAIIPLIAFGLMPYEVTVSDDGACEFRAAFRVKRVRAQQITRLENDEGCVFIHHQRGKVQICELRDFDEFLARLVELNPTLELPDWAQQEVAAYEARHG
jgi:hypothetical protein